MSDIKLYNLDCMELLKTLPDNCIDLMPQDTPFEVTKNDWDIKPDLKLMWPEWLRVCKENAAMLFFATQPFASELIMSNLKMFRYDLIWYKSLGTGFLNANRMPMRNHESILLFYRKLPTFNPQMRIGQYKSKAGMGAQSSNYGKAKRLKANVNNIYFPESVINITNGDRQVENDHPTQKPLDLMRYLISTYSNEGDTIFDGYSGSGSTAHACIVENRNFIGAENKKEYYDKSLLRLKIAKDIYLSTIKFPEL